MKLTKPVQVFIRSYFVIVLAILLIALALDSLLVWLVRDNTVSDNTRRYGDSFVLIQTILESATEDGKSLDTALSEHHSIFADAVNAPVTLYSESDFSALPEFQQSLATGAIVPVLDSDNQEILYQRLPGSGRILAIGPLPKPAGNTLLEPLVITTYYLLVAIIVFLWIRPFYRDLSVLRSAAGQFGRNDFSTRVNVADSSGILPVAQSFNAMAERIQYLVSAHRELTNAVSHELRTPLARFRFSLEMVSKTEDPARKQHYLSSMKDDVSELESLIDEMLSYARLSEQNLQMHTTAINIKSWLQQQLQQYRDHPVQVQTGFNPDSLNDDFHADCNPDLMARALHNVLRNCLRYAGSTISISLKLSTHTVTLKICDDGPGIPAELEDRIFEPFSRMDTSRDKSSGGYGLGLAIANRILQRHKGSISVENSAPNGACFTLQWPRFNQPMSAQLTES